MKRILMFCLPAMVAAAFAGPVRAEDDFDAINATLRDRAVVMELADGVRRVRLRIRQEDGTWKLCTIAHLEGVERFLKLRLPDGTVEEDIEVAASFTDPFPYSHYQGRVAFGGTASGGSYVDTPMIPSVRGDAAGPTEEATVEESDIWKWRGRTLYFFNQYRGLQVIDVADPAAPERLATFRMSSSGEQMYLHPSADQVALLTHDSSTGHGAVVLVRHASRHALEEQDRIAVPGYILESRMVGSILYVVSRNSFEERIVDPDTGVAHVRWRSGLAVTRIDLSNPDEPVTEPALVLAGEHFNYWGAQVQATPQALLIATSTYDANLRQSISTVHVVDIADPDAAPAVTHRFPIAGQVRNKFNMRLQDDILTVVSQVWRGGTERRTYASVETFDLARSAGSGAGRLGHIEFAQNETITATRFVGDLCYVVTFLRIDPLFVVSLADPANPRLMGELEIPGFSTYLEPLGEDALISVGVEDSQIAVSWFDVSDSANPALSSRVYVGAPDGWSWTEANWDEKAFGFFPDDGWILLPYQQFEPDRGWVTGVQLIEMGDGELIRRGSFAHEFRARRARVFDDAIVSISGHSLQTLDITDPDHPALLADLALAWPADLVHRIGDSLVQLERGGGYWFQTTATPPARLRVSPVDNPETLTATLDLGPGRIVGSLLVDDCLWVAQSRFTTADDETGDDFSRLRETFVVTAVDLSTPDRPRIGGRDSRPAADDGTSYFGGGDLTGAILPDGTLCWYPDGPSYPFYHDGIMRGDALGPFFFPRSGRAYTVDIADKESPRILAVADLTGSNQHWNVGAYRLVGSVLHHGIQSSTTLPKPDGTTEWRSHHWLATLDLTDPAAPVKGDLVPLPGTFEHAFRTSAGGTVLFTSLRHSAMVDDVWTTEYRVQALAFDGVLAYLLDELVVPGNGYGPRVFNGSSIVLGETIYGADEPHTELAVYQWRQDDSFQHQQDLRRPGAVYQMAISDRLLITTGSSGLTFIDFADPGNPDPSSVSVPNLWFWQGIGAIDIYRREFAYVPRGVWGVEPVDLRGVFAPPSARGSEEPAPGADPEWMPVDLALLSHTGAESTLLIGALGADNAWTVTGTATHLSYEAWICSAFGLPNEALAPAPGEDSDRDGLSNGWEYYTGSDPGRASSSAPPRPFLTEESDGSRRFNVRIFINPHAHGVLQPELSHNGFDWHPATEDVEFTADPFSPSVVVRLPAPPPGQAVQLFRFSFQ